MAQKVAFDGTPLNNEAFQLAGRRILFAPVNTAMPPTVQPVSDLVVPAGWADLGITVSGLVDITADYTVQNIVTGVISNIRRTYIDSQTGKFSAKIFANSLNNLGVITGQGTPSTTVSTSLNRAFRDLGVGGTLGSKVALLAYEDFDIPYVDGATSYDQSWFYTPTAQRGASINFSEFETKTNVITLDYTLLPFTNAAFSGRSLLFIQRFLQSA